MAAGAVANLSVKLTANTARFSADMARSAKSLHSIRSAAVTAQRGIRLVFGGVAVVGLVRMLSSAVSKAKEFRVIVDNTTANRINRLTMSYQAFGNAATRVVLKILSVAGPGLEKLIDRLTAAALWLESKINPQTLKLAANIVILTTSMVLAYNAFKLVVAVQALWNTRLKVAVTLQAILNALTGNWVAIAAAIAVAAGTTVALTAAFGEFGDDGEKDVKGVRSEVDKLKQSMMGLQQVSVGRMGIDFIPRSTLQTGSELGQYLSSQENVVTETKRVREELAKTRAAQEERANRRYQRAGPGHVLY